MGLVLRLLPHSAMTVSVAFCAADENEVVLEDLLEGKPLFRASSRGGTPCTWEAVNRSDAVKEYLISSRHRHDAASGQPWLPCRDKVLLETPRTRVVGYEDGADENYTDAVATVVWH